MHCGSFSSVVNEDLCFPGGQKIGAQQTHVFEMRAGVRRVHLELFAVDLNAKHGWDRVGSKQLVACLESVFSGYK